MDSSFPAPDLVDESRKIYERLPDHDEGWHSADEYRKICGRPSRSEVDEG